MNDQEQFDPPDSMRPLRPRDLRVIAGRDPIGDPAEPWQVCAMALVALHAMGRPPGARPEVVAEAAALVVDASAPISARAIIELMVRHQTFRLDLFAAEAARQLALANGSVTQVAGETIDTRPSLTQGQFGEVVHPTGCRQ